VPGFDAASVVEPLEYKFGKFVKGCDGVTPEPDDKIIAQFVDDLKKIIDKAKSQLPMEVDTDDPAAVMAAISSLESDNFMEVAEDMAAVYAGLTQGQPSAEDMLALPPRVRNLYYAWLQHEVMSPEAVPAAGTRAGNPPLRAVGG
jgi:hypothetical protein